MPVMLLLAIAYSYGKVHNIVHMSPKNVLDAVIGQTHVT